MGLEYLPRTGPQTTERVGGDGFGSRDVSPHIARLQRFPEQISRVATLGEDVFPAARQRGRRSVPTRARTARMADEAGGEDADKAETAERTAVEDAVPAGESRGASAASGSTMARELGTCRRCGSPSFLKTLVESSTERIWCSLPHRRPLAI